MSRDFMGRPDRHRKTIISSNIVSPGGVVRRATRDAKPEPVWIDPRRLDAVEAALVAAEKAGAAAIEWREMLEEKGGTCLRNERHEDLHWELCGEPTTGTSMYCERHMLDALGPPMAGSNAVASVPSTLTPSTEKPFDPLKENIEATNPRVGAMFKMAYQPAPPRNKWGLRSSKPAALPAEPPNPTIERERQGHEFPVHTVSTTISKYEPVEYTINPAPLRPCDADSSHGFYAGNLCPRCMEELQRRTKEDEKAARKRAQATERQRRHRLFTTKAAK